MEQRLSQMPLWTLALVLVVAAAIAGRVAYRRWRHARIASRRIVEKPNSFYSSAIVKAQVDRQRWGQVDLDRIHPVNREEVERLLALADLQGADALSPRERMFLETMTRLSFG